MATSRSPNTMKYWGKRLTKFRLSQELPRGGVYHLGRSHLTRKRPKFIPHTHVDYAEVFWIADGRANHCINGLKIPVTQGDLVFIRREDIHAFRLLDDFGIVIANLSIPDKLLQTIRARFDGSDDFWPWTSDEMPYSTHLDAILLAEIESAAKQLDPNGRSRLRLEAFIHNVMLMVNPTVGRSIETQAPDWLRRAIEQFDQPDHLVRGVPELARLSGRSVEHLNRTVKKITGHTTSQLVNDLRVDYASRQLRDTDRPLSEIASNCGLDSLSHFHRIFRERTGMTPRKYRSQREAMV